MLKLKKEEITMNNMANREEGDKLFTEVEQALGAVFNLMASHPAYAGRNIADLHAKLLPPIAMRQYRMCAVKTAMRRPLCRGHWLAIRY